jgi:hypothetical protein
MDTLTAQDGWWLLSSTTRPEPHMIDFVADPRFPFHAVVNRPIYLAEWEAAILFAHPLPPGYRWTFDGPPERRRWTGGRPRKWGRGEHG